MPVWMIEFFGASDLDAAFLLIAFMTAPVWLAMILFPANRVVRRLADPWCVIPVYSLVLFFLLWKSYEVSILPDPLGGLGYREARDFAGHPVAFLSLFCNFQILNLAVGAMIYRKANRVGTRAPVELILCWLLGAPAAVVFVLRLLVRRRSLR